MGSCLSVRLCMLGFEVWDLATIHVPSKFHRFFLRNGAFEDKGLAPKQVSRGITCHLHSLRTVVTEGPLYIRAHLELSPLGLEVGLKISPTLQSGP